MSVDVDAPGVTTTAALSKPGWRREGWPLSLLFLGYPLWWVLGLGDFIFLIMSVPMGWALWRRGNIRAPRGFGIWLLFLGTVVISAGVLGADAPGAVPGQFLDHAPTYVYRCAWYLACTIVLLYVGNATLPGLSFQRVSRLLAAMFVVTVLGGLLGVVAPRLQFPSLLELGLPHGLAHNKYVYVLIHPASADTQTVLGYASARPRAPFAYANSWGANFSFFLPYFLYSWFGSRAGLRRWAAPVVLAAASVPVIYSLNRGLWAVLLVGCVYGAVQLVRLRGPQVLGWLAPLAALLVLAVVLSPLTTIVSERLAHPHSNARRYQLSYETVRSVLTGSPIIGFGNTRNVQGAFSSIAGGPTAACPACGVPPFGTQGHLWLVIFSQGLVGALLFVGFFAYRLVRHLPSADPPVVLGLAVGVFFLIEIFVYDTLGSPLFTVMLTLGLMWRAGRTTRGTPWSRYAAVPA